MDPHELSGTYTYRSFINEPKVVGSFGELQFAQAELTLFAGLDGNVTGFLSWPTKADDSERAVMDIEGRMVVRRAAARPPRRHRPQGLGHRDVPLSLRAYACPPLARDRQAAVLSGGSVLRVKDHGTAKAGVTASVIAVSRDFVEPRDIAGVALAPPVVAMLAGKWHRLWHATWHTVRGEWPNFVDETTRTGITGLGWGVELPPRKKRNDGSQVSSTTAPTRTFRPCIAG